MYKNHIHCITLWSYNFYSGLVVQWKVLEIHTCILYNSYTCFDILADIWIYVLECKTCDILAAEQLRLMRFDNLLIIDSFQKAIYVYSNDNFGRVFYIIQHCLRVNIVATCYPSWTVQMTDWEWTNHDFGRKGKWCAVPELGKETQAFCNIL